MGEQGKKGKDSRPNLYEVEREVLKMLCDKGLSFIESVYLLEACRHDLLKSRDVMAVKEYIDKLSKTRVDERSMSYS